MPLNLDLERDGHGANILPRFGPPVARPPLVALVTLVALTLAGCSVEQDPGAGWQIVLAGAGGAASGAAAGAAGRQPPAGASGSGGQGNAAGEAGVAGATDIPAGTAGVAGGAGTAGQGGAGVAGAGDGGQSGTDAGAGGDAGAGQAGGATGGQAGSEPTAGGQAGSEPATGGQAGGEPATGGQAGATGGAGGCPAGMVSIENFCMDRYEAPNEPGALPLAMRTAPEGEAWCGERGKALCSEAQWLRACQGTQAWTYPYGDQHEAHRCNDDKTWISPDWTTLASWPSPASQQEADDLYQADPSGSRAACLSAEGVADLTGNVAEWTRRSFATAKGHDHVLKGCYWSKCYGGSEPSCGFVNGAHPGTFRTYEAGFRCCLGPDP